ncbi:hypothetical protein [Streptomyces sp. DH37]|uniref:hypothetical protein n=1 Tax=Streptomyces sp. DH37 TaxID=3040122 RepID=UPI0024427096|nr:hypothetical protein [Streptomyces sp. DH37]MDG9704833.1 hypothetical protein [Streptomyces sp. DH37]
MADTRRKLARAWWAADRILGGRQRPTRFQRFIARHPLGVGLTVGAPLAGISVALSEGSMGDAVIGVCFGAALGTVFGLTALSERHRQRRLLRPSLRDSS